MTEETDSDDYEVSDVEMAQRKLKETLEHIEDMDGSGIWGLIALVVGLLLKAVLWKVDRETTDGAGGEDNE